MRQGESINLGENGRVILSSVEFDAATGRQYIHWQRCAGDLNKQSLYGNQGSNNGLGAHRITGVGRTGNTITAPSGSAVMVAEIYYEYESLIGGNMMNAGSIRQEAVFAIRDDRNLTPGVTGTGGTSSCS
jgi:hypothetical protein